MSILLGNYQPSINTTAEICSTDSINMTLTKSIVINPPSVASKPAKMERSTQQKATKRGNAQDDMVFGLDNFDMGWQFGSVVGKFNNSDELGCILVDRQYGFLCT